MSDPIDSIIKRCDDFLRRAEWSGKYEYVEEYPCCPICGGVKPGYGDINFIDFHKEDIGHRRDCVYYSLWDD